MRSSWSDSHLSCYQSKNLTLVTLQCANTSIILEILPIQELLMELEIVAKALKELGHPTRLAIYKTIVKAGYKGVAVGVIQEKLNVPGSTLSHHISSLASAGLLSQRREGRTLYCVAEYQCLDRVIGFLKAECCCEDEEYAQTSCQGIASSQKQQHK